MLKYLCSIGARVIAVTVCVCATATADDAATVKNAPRSVPSTDKRIQESMTVDTAALFGFTNADIEKANAEKLAKYLGPEVVAVSAAAQPGQDGFGEYVIDSGDVLEFVAFDDVTLNREITVRYDGFVSLPRVPDVKVAGLTRPAAQEAIREVYSKIYRDPEISLSITTPASKAYVVTGDVQTPGRYPFERTLSLWDAISQAGGLRERNAGGGNGGGLVAITGQITKAFVIRRANGERQVMPYDLRGLGKPGDYQGDTPIYYGDIVYVPEGVNLVYLLGESRAPVIVELIEGMTLLQMLALSGGFDASTAKISSVVLLRQSGEGTTDLHKIDLRAILKNKAPDMPLQPGDVVYLPRKTLVRLQEFIDRSVGSLSQILGLYTQAIDAAYALDLSRETLDALENSNNVSIPARSVSGISPLPRILGTGTAQP